MTKLISKILSKWQLVIYLTFMAGACAFFASTMITPKYQSDITILIVQKKIDAASASRSVEYLSEVFSQVIYTELFLDDVLNSPFQIEKKFSEDPGKKKQQWKDEVVVEKVSSAGILKISVFDESRAEAQKIALAIANNFAKNSQKYHGSAGTIEPKLIDGPITSSVPATPNVFVSTMLGLLVGFASSLLLIIFNNSIDIVLVQRKDEVSDLVKKQMERQIEKRQQDSELLFDVTRASDLEKPKKKPKKIKEKFQIKEPTFDVEIVEKKQEQKPDFEGSMIEKEEFEKRVSLVDKKIDKEVGKEKKARSKEKKKEPKIKKEETESAPSASKKHEKKLDKKQVKQSDGKAKPVPSVPKEEKMENGAGARQEESGDLLSKLYGKSLFADRKYEDLKAARTSHHPEAFLGGDVDESVKKVVPKEAEAKEAVKKSDETIEIVNPITTKSDQVREQDQKAPAPENLPIFMNNKEVDPVSKKAAEEERKNAFNEIAEIEHVGTDFSDQKEGLIVEKEIEGKGTPAPGPKDIEQEPTEAEVKERLNKLLKGEF